MFTQSLGHVKKRQFLFKPKVNYNAPKRTTITMSFKPYTSSKIASAAILANPPSIDAPYAGKGYFASIVYTSFQN